MSAVEVQARRPVDEPSFEPAATPEERSAVETGNLNPLLQRVLQRIAPETRETFSAEQLQALDAATSAQPDHWIDFRASSRVLRKRVFLQLVVGEEQRSLERLIREQQVGLAQSLFFFAVIGWVVTSVGAGITLVSLYLIKSALGINLTDGPSFLHRFFFD